MLKMYRNVAVSAYCWLVLPRLELRQGNARVWFTCFFLKHLRGIDFCEDVRLVFSDGVEGARDTYYYSVPKDFERLLVNVFVRCCFRKFYLDQTARYYYIVEIIFMTPSFKLLALL